MGEVGLELILVLVSWINRGWEEERRLVEEVQFLELVMTREMVPYGWWDELQLPQKVHGD